MVRFLCFYSPVHYHKPKNTVHMSTEAMQKTLEDYSANQPKKDFALLEQVPDDTISNSDDPNRSPSSVIEDPKSERFITVHNTENDSSLQKTGQMRKSVSLGSSLGDYNGRTSADGCSIDYEYSSFPNTRSETMIQLNDKDLGLGVCDENQNTQTFDSCQVSSNMVDHELVFSTEQSEKDICENSESQFSEEYNGNSPHVMVKSSSLPFLDTSFSTLFHQSRYSDDLKALESTKESSNSDSGHKRVDGNITPIEKTSADDSSDSYRYMGSAKDWIIPGVDESCKGKNIQEDYSVCRWDRLPNKDFKIKRIEKWVMDHQYSPLDETNGPLNTDHLDRHGKADKITVLDGPTASRTDSKVFPRMDATKRYISSLSGSSTAAQLVNHGLVTIPFLCAFASLKVLSLSGNMIVRITAGVLPLGLHILNLSKNSISVIEGLRELTRLRVLDLSYNRILRIGHGLASCSSLKELYLAGNKISEVEGLHRLLKLNVLDLRFNKLSTTKSLGQLAANYNSLQAISLEGNPAQKNVGDEHLKKYLISLLPHLAYFNRQSIKSGAMKDPANHAARLGLSDHRLRKSTHGRKSQVVSSRGRHVRLPPSGMKTRTDRHHDSSSKPPTLRPEVALRRSRSEGVLGAI